MNNNQRTMLQTFSKYEFDLLKINEWKMWSMVMVEDEKLKEKHASG